MLMRCSSGRRNKQRKGAERTDCLLRCPKSFLRCTLRESKGPPALRGFPDNPREENTQSRSWPKNFCSTCLYLSYALPIYVTYHSQSEKIFHSLLLLFQVLRAPCGAPTRSTWWFPSAWASAATWPRPRRPSSSPTPTTTPGSTRRSTPRPDTPPGGHTSKISYVLSHSIPLPHVILVDGLDINLQREPFSTSVNLSWYSL